MLDHIRILGTVSLVRAAIECACGLYFVKVATRWTRGDGLFDLKSVADPNDHAIFTAVGWLLIGLALVRAAQAIASLMWREWGRQLGVILGVFDVLLPVTLPMALWSFVVYPNQETRDHFRRHGGRSG